MKRFVLAVFFLMSAAVLHAAQPKEFSKWPKGTSPKEIGARVANRFVTTIDLSKESQIYPAMCAWYGALTFADVLGDHALAERLTDLFDVQVTPEVLKSVEAKQHVDFSMLGSVPLEIYLQTKRSSYLEMGRRLADHQWEEPRPDGLTRETRFWIDDMYMITVLQVQAYRATGDKTYLDRAALEMESYLAKLQQSNGLFYHAPDVPFFWGRGDGWVAAGLAELLRSLPANHPRRAKILDGYLRMMKALLRMQGKDGLWKQLLDKEQAWPETSSTAMFTFAMATGVKQGWLKDRAYARAARKGWLGLVSYLEPNGDIRNVCEGTGKNNDYDYYLNRKRLTGDLHGQAPLLWCATAFLR
ncbi:MAG TPA: glycoside hydrolase family 88 protein [Terriglobales bacterium]